MPIFNPLLTGYATYNKRNEFLSAIISQNDSKGIKETVLSTSKSLKFLKEPPKNTYLPTINKFEGYV